MMSIRIAGVGAKGPRRFSIQGSQCYLDGAPWRGAGVNFYDIRIKSLATKKSAMQPLADYGIPFMRFNSGYAFCGLLLISWALTYPGAFSAQGLLGAKVNTTGWIAAC